MLRACVPYAVSILLNANCEVIYAMHLLRACILAWQSLTACVRCYLSLVSRSGRQHNQTLCSLESAEYLVPKCITFSRCFVWWAGHGCTARVTVHRWTMCNGRAGTGKQITWHECRLTPEPTKSVPRQCSTLGQTSNCDHGGHQQVQGWCRVLLWQLRSALMLAISRMQQMSAQRWSGTLPAHCSPCNKRRSMSRRMSNQM
jgi:hypothetical protein